MKSCPRGASANVWIIFQQLLGIDRVMGERERVSEWVSEWEWVREREKERERIVEVSKTINVWMLRAILNNRERGNT
jgi:hypothetical protein